MFGMPLIPPFKVVIPPGVKLPTERIDFRIVADDPVKSDLIQVVHRQCGGGGVHYVHDDIDPPMSEFVCTGTIGDNYDCPGAWKRQWVEGATSKNLATMFSTRLIIDEHTYQRPVKLVERRIGKIVFSTMEPMTDSEVQGYFQRALLYIRQEARKKWG